MDDRFPKWLRWIVRKLDFLGLPNLAMLVCGLTVLGYIGRNFLGADFERFLFDPNAVMNGEWWRLLAFPGTDIENPLFLFLYVLYIYFIMGTLESHWGPGPLTVFTLFGYLSAIGASFIAGRPLSVWFYVLENVSLAFGTLFPNLEMYLYFVLPVKAKWLALLAGALILIQFVMGDGTTKIFLAVTLAPYLVFFGPLLFDIIRYRIRRRRKFDGDMWR